MNVSPNSSNRKKYTEPELKSAIIHEDIPVTSTSEKTYRRFHYSLCKKSATTISILSHWRLLIYDEDNYILFYANDYDSLPFLTESRIPKPKNDYVNIPMAVIKQVPKSNELLVQFNKVEKNSQVTVEWKFEMASEKLAKEWEVFIRDQKHERAARILGSNVKKEDAAVISDTLAFGMLPLNKTTEVDHEEKKQKETFGNFLMGMGNTGNTSKMNPTEVKESDIRKSTVEKDKPNDSQIKPEVKPAPPNQDSSLKPNPNNISNSRLTNSRASNPSSALKPSPQKSNIQDSRNSAANNSNLRDPKPTTDPKKSELRESKPQPKPKPETSMQGSRVDQPHLTNSRNITYIYQDNHPPADNTSNNRKDDKFKDWNVEFIDHPTELTISQFQAYAGSTFTNQISMEELLDAVQLGQPGSTIFQRGGLEMTCAIEGTPAAHLLECEFKNYHFILESCHQNCVIGVPLCCVINFMGIMCLVKAQLPKQAVEISSRKRQLTYSLRTLEKYTKLSSKILQKKGKFYDLSEQYGRKDGEPRIFLNNLIEYLPYFPSEGNPALLRGELILDNFPRAESSFLEPEDIRSNKMLIQIAEDSLAALNQMLSEHDIVLSSYGQLEELMHSYGLNMKLLPELHTALKNKLPKRYVHTAMLAKVLYEEIYCKLSSFEYSHEEDQAANEKVIRNLIEDYFRAFFEGGSSINVEAWKAITIAFKKSYRSVLNINQIQSGYLLACLMELLPADYNTSFLVTDRESKRIFDDEGIIGHGFIDKIGYKMRGYYRYRTESVERVLLMCQNRTNVNVGEHGAPLRDTTYDMGQIEGVLIKENEQQGSNINGYLLGNNRQKVLTYLSNFMSGPKSTRTAMKYLPEITSYVNLAPPTHYSHEITLRYLDKCLDDREIEMFQSTIETSLQLMNFWFGEDHPYLCDYYQLLSRYYSSKHNHEDSINYLKQSLTTCIRAGGTHTRQAGVKYFLLGDKQLSCGYKKEAGINFEKAQTNMEAFGVKTNRGREYSMLMMRMATLALSQGDVNGCIANCIKSIKSAEGIQSPTGVTPISPVSDAALIKNYELLCRSYEINRSKQELKNLCILCGKAFNKTQDPYVFDQMIRICMTGAILNLPSIKQSKLLEYVTIRKKEHSRERSIESASNYAGESLQLLMKRAQAEPIMERIPNKLEHIDRIVADKKSSRQPSGDSDTLWLLERIIGSVGSDFIEGILSQSSYV